MVKVANMPRTQISERLGSNGSVFDHSVPSNVHRSRFDLSYKKMFTGDIGMIMPIDLIRTLPGDDFEISVDYLLDTLPMVAPPMTNYRVVTHWYYCRLIDLWEGAETFVTRGRSGAIDLEIPKLNIKTASFATAATVGDDFSGNIFFCNNPQSLSSFLGLPPLYYGYLKDGSLSLEYNYLPYINPSWNGTDYDYSYSGDDTESDISESTGLYVPDQVNALPFFMYQKIYRQNYLANNLMQDNKVWFPDNLSDTWRINYSASNLFGFWSSNYCNGFLYRNSFNLFVPTTDLITLSSTTGAAPYNYMIFNAQNSTSAYLAGTDDAVSSSSSVHDWFVPSVDCDCVNLLMLRYAMWKDDYFTTALPWSTRGEAPTVDSGSLDLNFSNNILMGFQNGQDSGFKNSDLIDSLDWQSSASQTLYDNYYMSPAVAPTSNYYYGLYVSNGLIPSESAITGRLESLGLTEDNGYTETTNNDFSVPQAFVANTPFFVKGSIPANIAFTANTLRNLLALSVWQERNARTNGNYNSTIFAHFRVNPHSDDYEPKYIGGTADYIQFTKVIQTSATDVDSDSYLGSEAGLGSLHSSGFVGRFHCSDYGYIMGVMIITPEVSYSGGIDRLWFETTADEQYFPEYASLGLQEIYNKEIYVAEDDETQDNDLFGYQERYTYYKTRRNQVSGLFALTPDSDLLFSAYVQNRYFDSLPELSQQFVTMGPHETRRDFLAYPSQPAFRIQLANKVYAVRALPYQNVPQTFGF